MSIHVSEDGSIRGICKDGLEIIVDGELLLEDKEEE